MWRKLDRRSAGSVGFALVAAGVAVVACVQTVLSLPLPPGSDSEVIGTGGGTLTTSEGTVLVVPPGALDANVTITVAENPSPPLLTQAVAITPAHTFGPEGQKFSKPVCITLPYEPEQLPPGMTGQNVFLYSAPVDSGMYQVVPSLAVDPTHVMGMTTHFCNVFVAYADAGPELPLDAACAEPDADAAEPDADAAEPDAHAAEPDAEDGG